MKKIIPEFLKAAVLYKSNKPLLIKKLKIPDLKRGQVLVKIFFSGICKSQLMEIQGKRGKDKWLPHLLGHEASGEVINIGTQVKKVTKGDKVVLTWIKGKGLDVNGPKYNLNKQIINSGPLTTFSNYAIVSENRLQKIPKNFTLINSALFGCALPTGFGMVYKEYKLKKINSIAIIGLGGIGLCSVVAAKVLKIKKIIAIDISEKKLILSKKFGANYLINSKKNKLHYQIENILPKGVDLCIEATGFAKSIENGFSIINNKYGKVIFASHPSYNEKIKIDPFELISGKKIEGSWGGGVDPDKDFTIIAKLLNNKVLNKFITKIYSLENINKAILDFKNGKVLRPMIKMKHYE